MKITILLLLATFSYSCLARDAWWQIAQLSETTNLFDTCGIPGYTEIFKLHYINAIGDISGTV